MPISEMQSRLYFQAFTQRHLYSRRILPTRDGMLSSIAKRQEAMARRYVESRRHTIQVDYIDYMNELSALVGCQPAIWRRVVTDPGLACQLLFGPAAPYSYRLDGPKQWSGARTALLSLQKRVDAGMRAGDANRAKWELGPPDEEFGSKKMGKVGELVGKVRPPCKIRTVWLISIMTVIAVPLLFVLILRLCNCT